MENPKFKPEPGQVDYTNARWAPVINCVLKFKDKILIVKRNEDLNFYPGYWNGISGFLDDSKSLEEKAKQEIKEELGIGEEHIISIRLGEIFDQEEPKYKKTWIVHPVLVEVNTDKIFLDWEAQNYQWTDLEKVKNLELLPGFNQVLQKLFKNQ
jgi:isopentenyldiphosphate isomerase